MLLSMLQQQSYGEVSNQQLSAGSLFSIQIVHAVPMVYSFDFIILISFSNVTLSIDMGHFKVLYVIHLFDIKWHFHCWLENLKKKKLCIKIFIFKLFGPCMCKMRIKQAFTFSFKKLIMCFPCINLQVKWLPCIYFTDCIWLPRFSLQLQDFHAWIDYFAWFDMLKFSKLLLHFPRILAW